MQYGFMGPKLSASLPGSAGNRKVSITWRGRLLKLVISQTVVPRNHCFKLFWRHQVKCSSQHSCPPKCDVIDSTIENTLLYGMAKQLCLRKRRNLLQKVLGIFGVRCRQIFVVFPTIRKFG